MTVEGAFNGIVLNKLWTFVQVCPEEHFDMNDCKVFSLKLTWKHPVRSNPFMDVSELQNQITHLTFSVKYD